MKSCHCWFPVLLCVEPGFAATVQLGAMHSLQAESALGMIKSLVGMLLQPLTVLEGSGAPEGKRHSHSPSLFAMMRFFTALSKLVTSHRICRYAVGRSCPCWLLLLFVAAKCNNSRALSLGMQSLLAPPTLELIYARPL
jgi:hypothetical protein